MGVATTEAPRECSWHTGVKNDHFWGFRLHGFQWYRILSTPFRMSPHSMNNIAFDQFRNCLNSNDAIINGIPKSVSGPSSCQAGMEFKMSVDIEKGLLSCYCNGKLSATLDGLPKDVELYPACYLGGHKKPMIFTTTFEE